MLMELLFIDDEDYPINVEIHLNRSHMSFSKDPF